MSVDVIKETFDLRECVYKRVINETEGQPRIIRTAKCLAAFLMEKAVQVSQVDVLAGNAQYCNCAYSAPRGFAEEIALYTQKTRSEDVHLDTFEAGLDAKLYQRGQGGHVIAGYDYVLEAGVDALIANADECVASLAAEAHDLAVASGIVCRALSAYIKRYAEEARRLGQVRIANACEKVAHHPAESFFEAVQLMWLVHEVVIFEQYCGSMSLGRLDKTLMPYYEKDVANGTLDRDAARAILEALFKKLSGLRRGYQNVTLGGTNGDSTCIDNDITRMCLEVSGRLMTDQPLLSMRYTPDMSDGLWDDILALMQTGIGFPAMFNDKIAIRSKVRAGIPETDAANYGVIGCVEVSVPGKEFAHTEGLRINWAKVLELMISGGKCQYTGHCFDLSANKPLDSIASFDEFYGWYKSEFLHFLTLALEVTNTLDISYGENWPTPFMSSIMKGCVQRGKDVNAGGALYNLTSVNGCGMANAVDALCAVKKVVFEDKLCTLAQLAEILKSDFEGSEDIRQVLLRDCPKYGNDDDKADFMMHDLVTLFTDTVCRYRNPRGGAFQAGLYTVDHHALMGSRTAALPDGRKAQTPLANGFSPAQGADVTGPTAVIHSMIKNDLTALGNGMVLDLKFHPAFFKKNKRHVRTLIETYFDLGGYEIQLNVVDKKTLLKAQKKPEMFRDLIVRVSGFSAYFVELSTALQNEIIARTEHGF